MKSLLIILIPVLVFCSSYGAARRNYDGDTFVKMSLSNVAARSVVLVKRSTSGVEQCNTIDRSKLWEGLSDDFADVVDKLRRLPAKVKVCLSDSVAIRLNEELLGSEIAGLGGLTAKQVIDELRGSAHCLSYPFGGIVRDAILGKSPRDVDMEVSCNYEDMLNACQKLWCAGKQCSLCFGVTEKKYVVIGHDNGTENTGMRTIDSFDIERTFFDSTNLEFTANSVAYDPLHRVFIDLTGTGFDDARNKLIRIPVDGEAQQKRWAANLGGSIFRYWKLRTKGFEPVDNATITFVMQEAEKRLFDGNNSLAKFYCKQVYSGQSYNNSTCIRKYDSDYSATESVYMKYFSDDFGVERWNLIKGQKITTLQVLTRNRRQQVLYNLASKLYSGCSIVLALFALLGTIYM